MAGSYLLARALAARVGAAAIRMCRRSKCSTALAAVARRHRRSRRRAHAIDASGDVHVIGGGVGRAAARATRACRGRSAGWTAYESCRSRAAPRTRCSSSHAAAREAARCTPSARTPAGRPRPHSAAAAAAARHRAVRARRLARRGGCVVVVCRRGGGDARNCNSHGQLGNGRRAAAEPAPCASAAAPATPVPSPESRCTPRHADARVALGARDTHTRVWPSARGTASSSQSAALSSAAARMPVRPLGAPTRGERDEPTPAPLTLPTTAAAQRACAPTPRRPPSSSPQIAASGASEAARRRARSWACRNSADGEPSAADMFGALADGWKAHLGGAGAPARVRSSRLRPSTRRPRRAPPGVALVASRRP